MTIVTTAPDHALAIANGRDAPDPLAFIDSLIAEGGDPWEACIDAAAWARDGIDTGKWLIGDVALRVRTVYAEDRLSAFASAINVPVDRVREYRTVCRYWECSARAEFLACPTLTYTHLRDAMRFKNREAAAAFLRVAANHAWSVSEARTMMQRAFGKSGRVVRKVFDGEYPVQRFADGVYAQIAADVYLSIDSKTMLLPGRTYRFVIYEVVTP